MNKLYHSRKYNVTFKMKISILDRYHKIQNTSHAFVQLTGYKDILSYFVTLIKISQVIL